LLDLTSTLISFAFRYLKSLAASGPVAINRRDDSTNYSNFIGSFFTFRSGFSLAFYLSSLSYWLVFPKLSSFCYLPPVTLLSFKWFPSPFSLNLVIAGVDAVNDATARGGEDERTQRREQRDRTRHENARAWTRRRGENNVTQHEDERTRGHRRCIVARDDLRSCHGSTR
jgi:hypothetical protein